MDFFTPFLIISFFYTLPVIWYSYWHGLDHDSPAAVLDQHFVPVDPAAQTPLAAVQEVDTVVLRVEANHVTAQHALQYFVRPGEDPHDVPGGERDVEEETHPDVDLLLHTDISDGVGSQHQVVVVEPHQGGPAALTSVLPDALQCLQSEVLVDLGVGLPGLDVEHGLVGHGVEQRPEGRIAAAVVVGVEDQLGLHGDGDDVGGPEASGGRHVARAGLRDIVSERLVVSQSRPANPETLAVHNYRSHGSHQPSSTEEQRDSQG